MLNKKTDRIGGDFEYEVLSAILNLTGDAYAVPITRRLSDARNSSVKMGAVHTTLRRLEEKGFLKSEKGDATAQRGGKAKRIYSITAPGRQAMLDREREIYRVYPLPTGQGATT